MEIKTQQPMLPHETQQAILDVLRQSKVAEVKIEKENIVVVEQSRKLKVKSPFTKP